MEKYKNHGELVADEIVEQVIEAVMIIKLNNNNFRAFKIVFLP